MRVKYHTTFTIDLPDSNVALVDALRSLDNKSLPETSTCILIEGDLVKVRSIRGAPGQWEILEPDGSTVFYSTASKSIPRSGIDNEIASSASGTQSDCSDPKDQAESETSSSSDEETRPRSIILELFPDTDDTEEETLSGGALAGPEDALVLVEWDDGCESLFGSQTTRFVLMLLRWVDKNIAERVGLLGEYESEWDAGIVKTVPRKRTKFQLR